MPITVSTVREIKRALYLQMGVNKEKLDNWTIHTDSRGRCDSAERYPIDRETQERYWAYIAAAPAVKIVGDYDVDGNCAVYIMMRSIHEKHPNKKLSTRTPRRFSEGYGINDKIADEIIETMPKGSVIITVDNGIAAAGVLERLEKEGMIVLMTDHHDLREGAKVPNVTMTIDPSVHILPNPIHGDFGNTNADYWCGAGVAYKLCEGMISESLRRELLVYAGIATVADCMQLKEGNWALVKESLEAFHNGTAPKALTQLLVKMRQSALVCDEGTYGWYLGPGINAPGRLLDKGAAKVVKYFATPTDELCEEIFQLNEERKALRDGQVEEAKAYVTRYEKNDNYPLWVFVPKLHEGIVGIVAGRLSEDLKRPCIVCTTLPDYEISPINSEDVATFKERHNEWAKKLESIKSGKTVTHPNGDVEIQRYANNQEKNEAVREFLAANPEPVVPTPEYDYSQIADDTVLKGSARSYGNFNIFAYLSNIDNIMRERELAAGHLDASTTEGHTQEEIEEAIKNARTDLTLDNIDDYNTKMKVIDAKNKEEGNPSRIKGASLFERMGGHAGAAGLSIKYGNVKTAERDWPLSADMFQTISNDGNKLFVITKEMIPNVYKAIQDFAPFGESNPTPKFAVLMDYDALHEPDGTPSKCIRKMGAFEEHFTYEYNDKEKPYKNYKITAFNQPDKAALCENFDENHYYYIGTINMSEFRGAKVPQLNVDEIVEDEELERRLNPEAFQAEVEQENELD